MRIVKSLALFALTLSASNLLAVETIERCESSLLKPSDRAFHYADKIYKINGSDKTDADAENTFSALPEVSWRKVFSAADECVLETRVSQALHFEWLFNNEDTACSLREETICQKTPEKVVCENQCIVGCTEKEP
jgi:hypothetical protein